MMKTKTVLGVAATATILAGLPSVASAQLPTVCNEGVRSLAEAGHVWLLDHYSASDGAYFEMIGGRAGCGANFGDVLYYNWAYRTPEGSWQSAGYHDACNVSQPYVKFWMAGHLLHRAVNYGGIPPENHEGTFIRINPAFHDSRLDYGPLTEGLEKGICRGCEEKWHKGYYSTLENSYDLVGKFRTGNILSDFPNSLGRKRQVTSYCPQFDAVPASLAGEPLSLPNLGVRSGVMVHEAWHARYEGNDRVGKHKPNPGPFDRDNPTVPDLSAPCQYAECDQFIPKGKTAPPGGMYHVQMMPYQAEWHFQCDVLDSSYDWVPLAVMANMAIEHANLLRAFVKPPPYSCGLPKPIPGTGGTPSSSCPAVGTGSGIACTTALDCPLGGSFAASCDAGCCKYTVIR